MKKSLLALAVLGAFAATASAQSSVTIYGIVDANLGKDIGSDDKRMSQGAGSRLGFRGTEDLGGGLSAYFLIEHRFNTRNGELTNAAKFWQGTSLVGLRGGFGSVALGRQYTTSFLSSQLRADPWGFDTVANNAGILTGGIARVRMDNAITYNFAASGFSFGAQIAEGIPGNGGTDDRPYNFAVAYNAGPITAGFGYENPGDDDDHWMTLNGAYDLGMVKLGAAIGNGRNAADTKVKSWLLSATAPIGGGELRASYGQLKVGPTKVSQKAGLGYFYPLSKRTTVYADVSNDSKANDEKTGYDFGIKHTF